MLDSSAVRARVIFYGAISCHGQCQNEVDEVLCMLDSIRFAISSSRHEGKDQTKAKTEVNKQSQKHKESLAGQQEVLRQVEPWCWWL